MAVTSILTAYIVTASFNLKKKISKMDEKAWAEYFRNITRKKMMIRLFLCFAVSLLLIASFVDWVFTVINARNPLQMTILFCIFTMLYAFMDFAKNCDAFMARMSVFKK